MQFKLKKIAALLFGVGISLSVFAEDIELYVNHNVETDEKPRVIIVFDTSGSMKNWISPFYNFKPNSQFTSGW